jgi:phospholipase/carboxylesterase
MRARDASTPSRREFVALMASASMVTLWGCHSDGSGVTNPDPGGGDARLKVTPSSPVTTASQGTLLITGSNPNDGYLVVPSGYDPAVPMPLVVALAGAGQSPDFSRGVWGALADSRGFLLLAVGKRGMTWDALTYRYSYDVTFIDGALKWTFDRVAVDATRIVLAGFSDGATYGLGLGLANGDLFRRVVACSPGFIARSDSADVGKPKFFFSHGVNDGVLNIDRASRAIVPALKGSGYDVTYVEFTGGHEVPPAIAAQAADWFLA